MKTHNIFIVLVLFQFQSSFSQVWPKIFEGQSSYWCHGFIESYDKGYVIDIQVDPGTYVPQMHAKLIKTDINGNQLWVKTFSSFSYQVAFNGIDNTSDGGIIVTGVTTKLDSSNYDILLMKFNSCGDKEWCNIISTPGNDDYGVKIKRVSDGYLALIAYYQDWMIKRIWLFKLNLTGDIQWEQLINQNGDYIQNSDGYDLLKASGNNFLITGDGYDGSPGQTYYLRPLIIKTDSNGNVLWQISFGHTDGFRGNGTVCPQENQAGFYYMAVSHFRDTSPYGDSPCFLKVSPNGQEDYYKDLISNSISGGSSTLNLKNFDSLFISASWTDVNNISNIGIFKSDTLGNITKTKIIFQNVPYEISSALFTYDDMYLAIGDINPSLTTTKTYLYKFTSNLEYAPLNTQPRTYDSLCPHPIVSDTTSLDDCAVITDVRDPIIHLEKTQLHIYPNPAKNAITIEMPQKLIRQSSGYGVTATTYYHQWNTTTLEIYDLFGKLMYSKEIPKKTEKVEMDVTSWHEGMYVARVVFMNEVVAGEKFVVQ